MLERFKVVCIPCKALFKCSALPVLPLLTSHAGDERHMTLSDFILHTLSWNVFDSWDFSQERMRFVHRCKTHDVASELRSQLTGSAVIFGGDHVTRVRDNLRVWGLPLPLSAGKWLLIRLTTRSADWLCGHRTDRVVSWLAIRSADWSLGQQTDHVVTGLTASSADWPRGQRTDHWVATEWPIDVCVRPVLIRLVKYGSNWLSVWAQVEPHEHRTNWLES